MEMTSANIGYTNFKNTVYLTSFRLFIHLADSFQVKTSLQKDYDATVS